MSREVILQATGISKQYRLGTVGTGTVTHDLNRWWAKVRGKEDPYLKIGETNDRSTKGSSDYVWALQNIDFDVYRGEVLGIIGKNGAGKSTLLKILSRVTSPTTGLIKTRGRIASLLEVGTGFNGEMTGRENIFLNGAILGMTKKEIQSKIDEIIDFSGCQRYIDTPVKRYSSGMTVRLAFAVAAFLEPEILVIDEVLAVGDAEFQKKAIGKMQDISRGEGRTVIFVSHNMAAVKSLCTRGIVMENGGIVFEGGIEEVISQYQRVSIEQANYHAENFHKEIFIKQAYLKGDLSNFYSDDDISFVIHIGRNIEFSKNKFLLIRVMDQLDQVLFSCEIEIDYNKEGYTFTIPKQTLVKGDYKMNFIVYHPAVAQYDNVSEFCSFSVLNNVAAFSHLETFDIGKTYIQGKWD